MAKSIPKFRRTEHALVAEVLRALNKDFLAEAQCFFGGGTYLAMKLGEYRVSRDVDFLCASRNGFRQLREEISNQSLGAVLRQPLALARDVRADRDGIRTFFAVGATRVKFEILFESRIDLAGGLDEDLQIPALSPEHCVAEKLLANADRGLDDSTSSRDLVDLAFAAVHFGKPTVRSGLEIAERAYGTAVQRYLGLTLNLFQDNRTRANACMKSLAVEDATTLRKGLRVLRTLNA
jgi:hypothetical protein